jgi:hypothetical protein
MRHQNTSPAKENTQGRHYMPKSHVRALQAFDPARIAQRPIAKTTPQLRKLG